MTSTILTAHHLGKQVTAPEGILTILSDVHLEFHTQTATAILGASGSGKSTLLGLFAGLDTPTQGYVELLGINLNRLEEDERARLRLGRVGFVFQSFHLLPGLTALENVMLPLELAKNSQAQRMAIEVLDQVGLSHRLHHRPSQLSGGEQQRVALARAFALKPQILFADEPTGNLDQATGHHIIELLFSLRTQWGTALILVTHDAELANRCDQSYTLVAGMLK
jgi:putative ABC transport system ATP-binding protein